jgi:hypothetical protein
MTKRPLDVIQLWKDEAYRNRLTKDQLDQFTEESAQLKKQVAQVASNPAGMMEELSDSELRQALQVGTCTKYGSISTTWCDNPNVC